MRALTLKIDDSIYSNFLHFLELLPKDKAEVIEDEVFYDPNDETKTAILEIRDGKNLTAYSSVDEMFKMLSNKNA